MRALVAVGRFDVAAVGRELEIGEHPPGRVELRPGRRGLVRQRERCDEPPAVPLGAQARIQHGQDSERAAAFDVDWTAGGGRIRIPVVGDDDRSPEGGPVRNLRFTQSCLDALAGCEAVGRDVELATDLFYGAAMAPAVRLAGFTFTSTTAY